MKQKPDPKDAVKIEPWHGLDPGIRPVVLLLRAYGVDTCQSCQSGPGHCYEEPSVDFRGGKSEGFRVLPIVHGYAMPASELSRVWSFNGLGADFGEDGPIWRITFVPKRLAEWCKGWTEKRLQEEVRTALLHFPTHWVEQYNGGHWVVDGGRRR